MNGLTIGQVAKATQMNIETIRYYERRGLIEEPPRSESGYRLFPQEVIQALNFIKRGQNVGFTLKEIKTLMHASNSNVDSMDSEDIYKFTTSKIQEIEMKIHELHQMKEVLELLAQRCPGAGFSADECSVIQTLSKGEMQNE